MSEELSEKTSGERKDGISPNSFKLISVKALEDALRKDLGLEWNLAEFKIQEFTKNGDNYACTVVSVSCKGICNGAGKRMSYVAKLNPLRPISLMDGILHEMFQREGNFLMDASLKLNGILSELDYPQINIPECLYFHHEQRQELLLLRDLRFKGFKMFDRRIGMDLAHSRLLLKELAKLHAASVIFKKRLDKKSVLEFYPFMYDRWLEPKSESRAVFGQFLKNNIETALKMMQHLEQYSTPYQWLSNIKNQITDMFCLLVRECDENMRVICHGDCWNNNVLFTYDFEGRPKDVALLDFQLCRFASLGLDLNYFFYTSLTGEFRRRNLNQLMSFYYEEFEHVMEVAGLPMPFTETELEKEVIDKSLFGIFSGLTLIPMVISEGKQILDFNKSNVIDFLNNYNKLIMAEMNNSPVFRSRFLAILDDIVDKGLCNEK